MRGCILDRHTQLILEIPLELTGVGQPVSHVVSSFCRGDSVESWFDLEMVGDGS